MFLPKSENSGGKSDLIKNKFSEGVQTFYKKCLNSSLKPYLLRIKQIHIIQYLKSDNLGNKKL